MKLIDGRWQLDGTDWPIRAELEASPGAANCPHEECLVITQGGATGLRSHERTVHGSARTRKPGPRPA